MKTIDTIHARPQPASAPRIEETAGIPHPLSLIRLAVHLYGWRVARWRSRQVLGSLDDHALRDIGLTRAMANREAARPFWD